MLRAVSFPQPSLSPDDLASLQQAIQQDKADLASFNASAGPAGPVNYSNTVTGLPVDSAAQQESLAEALLTGPLAHPLTQEQGRLLAAANVNDDMSFTVGKVRRVAGELTGNISVQANTSRNNASTRLLVTILVTLLLLLLVLLIFTMVARSLTRPLRKLVPAGFSSLAAPDAGPPA
jgi:nitrogen fixation/metabolism regulation signal transduction histidine kinase